jgi:hypothetical protein
MLSKRNPRSMRAKSGKKGRIASSLVATRNVKEITYAWRRLHDGNIIAEVNSNAGMGVWRASAYRVTGHASEVAYTGRAFSLLTEAHHGADELVRRQFGHECRVGVCGRWLRWPSKSADTT